MYSSVKFFEPTVIVTLPLSGLDWISPAPAVDVDDSSLPPPQAAMPTASAVAANSNSRARARIFVVIDDASLGLLGHSPPRGVRGNPMRLRGCAARSARAASTATG